MITAQVLPFIMAVVVEVVSNTVENQDRVEEVLVVSMLLVV
jgi:hypothetical protein